MTQTLMTHQPNLCEECGGIVIHTSTGEVCSACGLTSTEPEFTHSCYLMITNDLSEKFQGKAYQYSYPFAKIRTVISNTLLKSQCMKTNHRLIKTNNQYNQPDDKISYRIEQLLHQTVHYFERKCLFQPILYDLQKIRKTDQVINHVTLVFSLFYKHTRLQKIPLGIDEIIQYGKAYGYGISKKQIVQTLLHHNIRPDCLSYEDYLPKYQSLVKYDTHIQLRLTKHGISKTTFHHIISKPIPVYCSKTRFTGINPRHLAATVIYARIRQYQKTRHCVIITMAMAAQIFKINEFTIRDVYTNQIKPYLRRQS